MFSLQLTCFVLCGGGKNRKGAEDVFEALLSDQGVEDLEARGEGGMDVMPGAASAAAGKGTEGKRKEVERQGRGGMGGGFFNIFRRRSHEAGTVKIGAVATVEQAVGAVERAREAEAAAERAFSLAKAAAVAAQQDFSAFSRDAQNLQRDMDALEIAEGKAGVEVARVCGEVEGLEMEVESGRWRMQLVTVRQETGDLQRWAFSTSRA